jgi:hypothetical protein
MADNVHKPIFITGLPRSGTSLVAGLLHACGAWVGNTVPGDAANPRGYFEHVIVRERIVKQLLSRIHCDPLGVHPLSPLDLSLTVSNLKQAMGTILAREDYNASMPWLYKDAKLTLLWPAFARAFPDATWIIVKRDRQQVIDSCIRTPFMAQHGSAHEFWDVFVAEYEARLTRLAETVERHVVVEPQKLVGGDYANFTEVLSMCGLQFRKTLVDEFICNDFWHG